MFKRMISVFSCVMVLALAGMLLPFGGSTRAQGSTFDRRPYLSPRPSLANAVLEDRTAPTAPTVDERLGGKTGPVKVVIEFREAPAAQVYDIQKSRGTEAQALTAARDRVSQIDRAQQQVVAQLGGLNAGVIYRTQRVFNGIAVRVDASRIADLVKLPGVKAIHMLVPKTLDNASSVPLIGAPAVWSGSGNTGQGMTIGVIDTGIDYLHTNNGGPGTEAAYDANNPALDEPADGFPSAKVVGGYDFVGDNYNANSNDPALFTPVPDPDPIDCNGHGSHVSGTAAGFGVNADGTTFAGPYNAATPFGSLRIGPGVAPQAQLYALKVFGCAGSTDVTDLAIEYATDPNGDGDLSDHLDVINMSLGSSFGSAFDTSAVASDNAVLAGVIVVTSAGNSSDTYYISGSPGAAGRAISTASSVDSTAIVGGFRVNAPASIAGVYPATEAAFGPNLATTGPVTGDIVYFGTPTTAFTGCTAFTPAQAAALAGKIALIDRGVCSFKTKVLNAQNAGAIGVLIVQNAPGDPITMGEDATITTPITIPSQMTTQSAGNLIKARLAASETVNVTLTAEFRNSIASVDPGRVDTLSTFSSRGPRRGDNALKPDITAPGDTIFSTATRTGNQGTTISGTSMASPHVAGTMALLRQIHPDWSVEELKALVMNTASADLRLSSDSASTRYGPGRVGAGRVVVPQAAGSQVVAYNATDSGLVSVSFGAPEVLGSASVNRTVRVVNKGAQPVAYNVGYSARTDVPGVSYTFTPSSITLGPGESTSVRVSMLANAETMKHTRDATVSNGQNGLPRHWLSEESGYLTLSPTSSVPALRVPIYAAPRPASDMQAAASSLDVGRGPSATTQIALTGQQVLTGEAFPTDEVSIATASELQLTSPNEARSEGLANSADLKYVGVASDVRAAGGLANSTLSFAIATHGNWSTPNTVEFDIYFDTNRDGTDDFVLFNDDFSQLTGNTDASDVFVSVLFEIDENGELGNGFIQDYINGVAANRLNTVLFNTNVMVLPVFASDLGLTDANSRFNYRLVSFSRDFDDPEGLGVDNSGVDDQDVAIPLTYDAANPGADTSGGGTGVPFYFDVNGATIPVAFNRAAFETNKSQGVLVFHHHNRTGDKDEVVSLVTPPEPTATSTPVPTLVPPLKSYIPLLRTAPDPLPTPTNGTP